MISPLPNERTSLDRVMRQMGWKMDIAWRKVYLAMLRQLPRWRIAVLMAQDSTRTGGRLIGAWCKWNTSTNTT